MLSRARLSLHFPRGSAYLSAQGRHYSQRRNPPSGSKASGEKWVQDVFSTGVMKESSSSQSSSLGGIFGQDTFTEQEAIPTETMVSPEAQATRPQIQESKQGLLPKMTVRRATPKYRVPRTEFHGRTSYLPASVLKINPLARLISRKPIDWAILQMRFSEKKYSKPIEELLIRVKNDVERVRPSILPSLIVHEIWVAKGPMQNKRIDIKARGRFGILKTRTCRVFVVLKPGQLVEQQKAEKRKKQLNRIVSAAMVREDVPIRNAGGLWRW